MSLQIGLGNRVSNSEVAQERSRQQFVMETLCFFWYLNYTLRVEAFGSVVSAVGKIFSLLEEGESNLGSFGFLLQLPSA